MITLRGISFSYSQQPVLQNLEASFQPGKFYGLFGANGCGKSTLLKIITGELRAQQGQVKPVYRDALSRARQLAVLEQEIPPRIPLSVEEVVRLGQYPWRRQGNNSQASDWALAQLQLQALCRQPYNRLSGGERQRVMLARVLAQDTPILLLDEPASSLDLGFRCDFYQTLRQLSRQGKCVIMISHDLFIAPKFLDSALLLQQGKILAAGSPATVLSGRNLYKAFRCPPEFWPQS